MTYVEALEIAIAKVDEATAEKLTALKGQIAKKRTSSKPTKKQVENEGIKAEILEVLGDEGVTVTEIVKALDNKYHPNKVTSMVHQLMDANEVKREMVKGKALFSLA